MEQNIGQLGENTFWWKAEVHSKTKQRGYKNLSLELWIQTSNIDALATAAQVRYLSLHCFNIFLV